ncbi:MAG: hypothetical protein M0025_08770 [Elusimicrobia bacterium]|nr:hypothetical protein [Elusimicrobiota bacterium]
MFGEDFRAKAFLYLGFFLTLFGYAGRFFAVEPVHNLFFPFAAWSYVLLADNLSWRIKGSSALVSRTEEFLYAAAGSVALAAAAELLNLRLDAWHYFDQSSVLSTRWAGRLFGWGAALPSIFATCELLSAFGLFRSARSRPFRLRPGLPKALALSGGGALAAAAAYPSALWPLAVPALLLLSEALNLRLGLPSLFRELAGGLPAKTLRLAAAGLICGLLWGWWNRGSGGNWQLSLEAFPGALRYLPAVFPLLGPAAYSFYSLASWLRAGKSWEDIPWTMPGRPPGGRVRLAALLIIIITSYTALRAVDAYTVRMYLGWL